MISIYSYINQNITNINFISNFCSIAKDISLSTSDKNIYDTIIEHQKLFNNLHVIFIETTDISTGYNIALKNTNHAIKLCLSPNEYIDIKYKNTWYDLATILSKDHVDAYAIPLVDKNMEYIQSKWFLHKDGCYRGKLDKNITEEYIKHTDGMDLISEESKDIATFRVTPFDRDNLMSNQFPFVTIHAP